MKRNWTAATSTGAIALMLLLSSELAYGVCQLPQPRLLCAEYSQSGAVVLARLVGIKEIGDGEAYRYQLTVVERLRGIVPNTFILWEENSSGRAVFAWKRGERYLLFLNRSSGDDGWTIDGCGNSGPIRARREAVVEIRRLTNREGMATVGGVVTTDSWTTGVAGVTVTASNGKEVRHSISDSRGHFRFHLRPGIYSFLASKRGDKFGIGPLSYESDRNVQLIPGSCAQIQFEQR